MSSILKMFVVYLQKHVTRFVSTLLIGCSLFSSTYAIDLSTVSQVFFFGDSLTDSGFNDNWPFSGGFPPFPALPAGKQPTFTTFGGYTWAQYVAHDIKGFALPIFPANNTTNNAIYASAPILPFVSGTKTGINFAAGGSTTNSTGFVEVWAPSLHQQVTFFLSSLAPGQRLDPNALYFVWEGANDLLKVLANSTPPTQVQLLQTALTAATNIGRDVALLSAFGAKRIVVLSLPNLGVSPLAIHNADPTAQVSLKNISFTFNSMLNTALGHVHKRFKHTKILLIDTYTAIDNLVTVTNAGLPFVIGGQSFQFVNATDPACFPAQSAILCPNGAPTNYVFADLVHPTDQTHRVLSLLVEQQLLNWS